MSDLERIRRISAYIETIDRFLDSTDVFNEALNTNVLDEEITKYLNDKKELLDRDIQEIKEHRRQEVLEVGSIFSYTSGDAISYTELHFIKILDARTDWRDTIHVATLVVGSGDSGKWIKYDSDDYLDFDEFCEIIDTTHYKMATEEEMNKYIEFSKTIPEPHGH